MQYYMTLHCANNLTSFHNPFQVIFRVTVTVEKCIESQSFLIGPLGFNEKLKVNVATRCECECDDKKELHPHCGGNGKVVCGGCR